MTTKAAQEAARVLENRRVAFVKKISTLLGHVSSRLDTRAMNAAFAALPHAGQEYGPAAEAFAAEVAAKEPVGLALHPRKVDAVKAAAEDAQRVIERVRVALEAVEWDLHVAAPYPDSFRMGRTEYQQKKAKRNLFSSLTTKANPQDYGRKTDKIVKMDEEAMARFIRNSEQDAALQYDMFICKMVSKVGEVTSATIEGNHVWAHSILTVTLASGEVQRWKTQQIVNYSVYGTPYLQWPSRIVK